MMMAVYDFTVIATGLDPEAPDFEDRFFEVGCDDALLGFQRGVITIDFNREAATFEDALEAAVREVHAAGARVERIEPDHLVNLSDIAERTGLTRQAIALYASGERGAGFPTPTACVTTNHPLYDWYQVALWFAAKDKLDGAIVERARVIRAANGALANIASSDLALRDRFRNLEAA